MIIWLHSDLRKRRSNINFDLVGSVGKASSILSIALYKN